MGNVCCETHYTNDLSYIDSLGSFIKFLLENLTRVQGEISNCSPNQKCMKSNEKIIQNMTSKNYERFQYYIFLNTVLVKIKILSEDYFFIKKGYQITEKDTEKDLKETKSIGMSTIDLKQQEFDLEKSKMYLGMILDTEDNIDLKQLETLNNQMLKNLYSNID